MYSILLIVTVMGWLALNELSIRLSDSKGNWELANLTNKTKQQSK